MRSKRETFWERLLASTVVIYTFCATFIVYKELRQYGTNWVLFFTIDVPTSWFYGIAVTRLVVSVIKKQSGQIQKWGLIAALNFGLPQLYILISAKSAPHSVYLIIYGVIVVLALFALGGVYSQIKSARTNEGARNHK